MIILKQCAIILLAVFKRKVEKIVFLHIIKTLRNNNENV